MPMKMTMTMTMMNTSRLYMIIISLNLIFRLLIAQQLEFSNLFVRELPPGIPSERSLWKASAMLEHTTLKHLN